MSSIGAYAPRYRAGECCSPAAERRGAIIGSAVGPGGGAAAVKIGSGAGTWDGIGLSRASRAGASGKGKTEVVLEGVAGVSGLRGEGGSDRGVLLPRELKTEKGGVGIDEQIVIR